MISVIATASSGHDTTATHARCVQSGRWSAWGRMPRPNRPAASRTKVRGRRIAPPALPPGDQRHREGDDHDGEEPQEQLVATRSARGSATTAADPRRPPAARRRSCSTTAGGGVRVRRGGGTPDRGRSPRTTFRRPGDRRGGPTSAISPIAAPTRSGFHAVRRWTTRRTASASAEREDEVGPERQGDAGEDSPASAQFDRSVRVWTAAHGEHDRPQREGHAHRARRVPRDRSGS